MTAAHAEEHNLTADISLLSPEVSPLEIFGAAASGLVGGVLRDRGVRFIGSSIPTSFQTDRLMLDPGGSLDADRVIAAPMLRGPRISGVPTNRSGFVVANASGRVEGLDDVYAVGDATTFAIKQGGLATQQADLVSQLIAADHGARVKEARPQRVLRARLAGGEHPIFLRAELDEYGQTSAATLEHVEVDGDAAASGKVFGRYLTPFLQSVQPLLPA
jgi:sulfide:quinone oxidoreductase